MYNEETDTVTNEYGVEVSYDAAVNLMDDELREMIHGDADAMDEQSFFNKYCRVHFDHFGEEFEPAKQNPVW